MPSFGEELKRERELREISLREVSQATKISMRFLEAMERNDFSFLPGGLFNRGFVRAYCQHIGIDSESMVNAYLLEEQAQESRTGSATGILRGRASLRATSDVDRAATGPDFRRWWVVAVVVLVLAVSVWAFAHFYGTAVSEGSGGDGTDSGMRRDGLTVSSPVESA
jgi:cytoskeletal protein RodZ